MRMSRLLALFLIFFAASAGGQEPFEGETLISPLNLHDSFIVDLDGTVLLTWHGGGRPASTAYLLADSVLLRPSQDPDGQFGGGGAGGWIQMIDANDVVIWDYFFSNQDYRQHHDIQPMPNGNVLLLAWERKSQAEAEAMGRLNLTSEMWPTLIVEVEPDGPTGGNIVWEWHLWDHVIQDVDPEKPNYGVVAEHPELLDINASNITNNGDWIHANAIDYNEALDQILFSARGTDEFYIIDHSTSTEEAAGHAGGDCGMGGDFIYRWGNPLIYDRGDASDHHFSVIHGANWIDDGLPGEGNVLALNNGEDGGDPSSVHEVATPLNEGGCYEIEAGQPYGPDAPAWTYINPGEFATGPTQGGAYRHPNGNTLITSPRIALVFEVTPAGETVWEYYYTSGNVPRAERYWNDETSVPSVDDQTPEHARLGLSAHPNPFNPSTRISYRIPEDGPVDLAVFGIEGRRIATLASGFAEQGEHAIAWNGTDEQGEDVSSGVYLIRLTAGRSSAMTKLVLIR